MQFPHCPSIEDITRLIRVPAPEFVASADEIGLRGDILSARILPGLPGFSRPNRPSAAEVGIDVFAEIVKMTSIGPGT
jgi:hypothetical protein